MEANLSYGHLSMDLEENVAYNLATTAQVGDSREDSQRLETEDGAYTEEIYEDIS